MLVVASVAPPAAERRDETLERCLVTAFDGPEDGRPCFVRERGVRGQEREHARLDAALVPREVGEERVLVRESERAREPYEIFASRKKVGLYAGADLRGVLGATKREVRIGDVARFARRAEAFGLQTAQRREGRAHPKRLVASSPN